MTIRWRTTDPHAGRVRYVIRKEHEMEIEGSPVWHFDPDVRDLTVNISMIRLVPRE